MDFDRFERNLAAALGVEGVASASILPWKNGGKYTTQSEQQEKSLAAHPSKSPFFQSRACPKRNYGRSFSFERSSYVGRNWNDAFGVSHADFLEVTRHRLPFFS
jgi:hypothetical protein